MAVTYVNQGKLIAITAGANQEIDNGNPATGGTPVMRVRAIRWVHTTGAAVAHNAQILDASGGNVLWEDVVDISASGEFVRESVYPNGLELHAGSTGLFATVDSGTLYLYLGGGRD